MSGPEPQPPGSPAPTTALVHLDTDLGTNPDDVAALVLLLGAEHVEVAGVTTAGDPDGRRAACVRHVLALAGRGDVEVTAGATVPAGPAATPAVARGAGWPEPLRSVPAVPGAAAGALHRSVLRRATVVAVGPLTNLADLARHRPGALAAARVVAMAGWTGHAAAGIPGWGPERDSNVLRDRVAAHAVAAAAGDLTLVPLAATARAPLRQAHLGRLRDAGALGRLLARQLTAWGRRTRVAELAAASPGLPSDAVAFLHDAVTCAAALGWDCVPVTRRRARVLPATGLQLVADPAGRPVGTVDDVDPAAFVQDWLTAVERADRRARVHRERHGPPV